VLDALANRPFRVLVPGVVALLLLLGWVQWRDPAKHRSQRGGPPDLEGYEDLVEPSLTQDEMVGRAEAFLETLGFEAEGGFRGIWVDRRWDVLESLRTAHDEQEIRAYLERGAPLIRWTVLFYRPVDAVLGKRSTRVTLDGSGRVWGFEIAHEFPEGTDFEQWVESTHLSTAAWLGLEPSALVPIDRTNVRPLSKRRSWRVTWRLNGLALGDFAPEVSARFWDPGRAKGVFSVSTSLVDASAGAPSRGRARSRAFWAAILLALLLAFVVGLAATRPGAVRATFDVRPWLVTGLGLAATVAAVQAVWMCWDSLLHKLGAGVFAGGAMFFAALAVVVVRHRPTAAPPGGPLLRGFLILAVPLAYFFMYLGCTLNPAEGCSQVCTLVRYTCAPLALVSLLAARSDPRFLAFVLAVCGVSLMPHCTCGNFINLHWIQAIGGSPMCYYFGFCAALLSVMGLTGVLPRLNAAVLAIAAAGLLAIGLSHQLLGFPW